MKLNYEFKYILFIIISFIFVMPSVRAFTIKNINEEYNIYNYYANNYDDTGKRYFLINHKDKDGKVTILGSLTGIVSRNSENKFDLICYDPCASPAKSYTADVNDSPFAQKMAKLMDSSFISDRYALAIAQMLAANDQRTHCKKEIYNNISFNIQNELKLFSKYCTKNGFLEEEYSKNIKKNNSTYLVFGDGPAGDGHNLKVDQLCKYYYDIDKGGNYTKSSTNWSLSEPSVELIPKEENGEEVTYYDIKFTINNYGDFAMSYKSALGNLQSKSEILPGSGLGSNSTTWYSISNKSYKFVRAGLNGNQLEVLLKHTGDCQSAVLNIDDRGTVNNNSILLANSGSNQRLALRSSLFKTSYRINCNTEKVTDNSKCMFNNESISTNNHTTCPKKPVTIPVNKISTFGKGSIGHQTVVDDCPKSSSATSMLTISNSSLKYAINHSYSEYAISQMNYASTAAFIFSEAGFNCCDDYYNPSFKAGLLQINPNQSYWDDVYSYWCSTNNQHCTFNGSAVYNEALPIPFSASNILMAQYAFEDLGCCKEYKNGTNGFGSLKTNVDWQNAYKTYCGGTTTEVTTSTACINPAPNSQTKVDNKINNCCLDDTHSYVQEVQLNDLFDNTKTHEGVTYFETLPTCEGSDLDVARGNINKYCDYYCTERLDIEVPGSTSADSGRYFKFNEIDGHASPKVDGYRRCRVTVKYDQWYAEYKQKLNELVTLYNEWQKLEAIAESYRQSTDTVSSGSVSYRCYKTRPGTSYQECQRNVCANSKDPSCMSNCTAEVKEYDGGHNCNYTYHHRTFANVPYASMSVINKTPNQDWTYPFNRSASSEHATDGDFDIQQSGSCDCKSSYPHKEGGGLPSMRNYSSEKSSAEGAANEKKKSYQDKLLKEIDELEKKLNECDRYLDDNYLYNLDPDVKFKYTQFFKNELGDPDSVITEVEYGDASCTTKRLDTANAKDKIEGATYSPNAGYNGVTTIPYSKLKNSLLLNQNPGLDNYTADMKFRYDKIYNTTCYWDNQSTYYTLVPSGASDIEKKADNYTVHDRVYKVLLTSYDGIYETYWELENLGHEGRLQQYFDNPTDTLKNKNNGENVNANTCSGLSESDADMLGLSSTFTCTFKVTHKAITTGRCNPDSGHDITLNGNSCDDKAEGYQLFYFKVADPSNLFPDGNGEYGKNWSNDMINKVQSTDTYNPANETYKFVLTQGDMKLIKEYNDSRESEGGYSDFDFSCTCTDACVNCKSKFLEDYYSGTFYSGSGTFTPAGKKLNEIREKYGW